mgnify:FL=1
MKVTEPRLNTLIDNLNTQICEDSLLTRQERETLVLAVAAMKARVSMQKGEATARGRRENQEKKDRLPLYWSSARIFSGETLPRKVWTDGSSITIAGVAVTPNRSASSDCLITRFLHFSELSLPGKKPAIAF